MKRKTTRSKLRELLTERYVPLLLHAGFRGPHKISGNKLFHDYRRPAPNGTHVLSIQFDKWQRPRFVIGLCVEPQEGIEARIAQGGKLVTGRLQPRQGPHTRSWFRADPPWWQRLLNGAGASREEEAVEQSVRLLPEVEAWWEAQVPSEHIRCLTMRYPGRSSRSRA